jgi:hypothetical protein
MAAEEPDTGEGSAPQGSEDEELSWPVGFIILVGLAALYVGWRLIQLLVRAVDWVF